MNETPTLRAWLDAGWERHDREPHDVLAGLLARAAALPDDDDGADAVRLARHTALGHLGDAAAQATLGSLLARLPAHAALAPAVERARCALALLAGHDTTAPLAVRCGVLGDVATALVLAGRLDSARAALFEPEAEAIDHADAAVRRAYAASANGVAGALLDGPRSAAHDALMLDAAALSHRAWARAGTWINVERADWMLAHCHAAAGDAATALRHAGACLARCEAEGADAFERFFGHEAMVVAHRAAGDTAAAAAHRGQMAALLPQVEDAGNRAYCEHTLAKR